MTPAVALARHGQTAYNAELRFQGHLPVPLTDLGREQARALAEVAAATPWARLVCSPLERAAETARIVGERLGLEPEPDARFAETDCGAWTGRLFAEVRAEDAEGLERFLAADPSWAFPGGESFAEQAERVDAALAEVRAGALPALVVCHGMTIRVALRTATALGAPVGNAELVLVP